MRLLGGSYSIMGNFLLRANVIMCHQISYQVLINMAMHVLMCITPERTNNKCSIA